MSESPSERSPLSGLVLFMVCLAIAGSFLAGAHYYAVDLPAQNAGLPPDNGLKPTSKCPICVFDCEGKTDYYDCMQECELIC